MADRHKARNWTCERGHTYQSPVPVTAVRCGICSKNTDWAKKADMKPDLEKPS